MSKLPVNQVRLTNIAVVRMKIKGKRFEIACYKNKVLNWRNKIERDLDETLQSRQIFTNVSKAIIAKTEDLVECFGTADHDAICKIILEKGEAQVSEKERQVEHDSKLKDIATIVADKTINRDTSRPFPVSMIESSMKAIHFSVHPTRSAKQQALELIRQLKSVLHIDRAQMRVRLEAPQAVSKQLKAKITAMGTTMEHEEFGSSTYEVVLLLDPGSYRELEESFKTLTKGKGRFDIVDMKVQQEGDIQLEEEQAALEARAAGIPEEDPAESSAANLATMRIVEPPSDTSQARADAIAKSQALKPIKKMIDSDDEDDRRKKKKDAGKKQVKEEDEDEKDVKSQTQPKKKERANKPKKPVTESDSSDDETHAMGMAKKRSAVRKQMKKKKQQDSSDDDDEEEESEEAKPAPKPATKAAPKKKRKSSSEEESDDEPVPKKKQPAPKKSAPQKKKQESSSEDESDDDNDNDKPASKAKTKPAAAPKKPAKKAESSDESESEEEKPKAKAKAKAAAKSKPKKQESSSDDDDEETTSKAKSKPKSAAKKKGKQRSDSDDD